MEKDLESLPSYVRYRDPHTVMQAIAKQKRQKARSVTAFTQPKSEQQEEENVYETSTVEVNKHRAKKS